MRNILSLSSPINRLTKQVYFSLLFKEKLNIRFLTGFHPYAVIICQSVHWFTFQTNGVVSNVYNDDTILKWSKAMVC